MKNVLVVDEKGRVRLLTDTREGKAHDKRVTDDAGYTLPEGSILYQDTAFQGFALEGVTIMQPKQKPRGRELTVAEKAENQRISAIRVRVEHAIGGVKRYRIVKDIIRLVKEGICDKVMETCCGLHNFRLRYRPWNYAT